MIIHLPGKNPDSMNRSRIWTRYPILVVLLLLPRPDPTAMLKSIFETKPVPSTLFSLAFWILWRYHLIFYWIEDLRIYLTTNERHWHWCHGQQQQKQSHLGYTGGASLLLLFFWIHSLQHKFVHLHNWNDDDPSGGFKSRSRVGAIRHKLYAQGSSSQGITTLIPCTHRHRTQSILSEPPTLSTKNTRNKQH